MAASDELVGLADLGAGDLSPEELRAVASANGGVASTPDAVASRWGRLPTEPSRERSGLPNASFTWYEAPDPLALTAEQCDEVLRATDALGDDPDLAMNVVDASHRAVARDRAWLIDDLDVVERVFDQVQAAVLLANKSWWRFSIDTWAGGVRGYVAPNGLPTHVDLESGNDRLKLAASVLLTDPDDFDGGQVEILFGSSVVKVPRTRGTVVVFPAWLAHRVSEVTRGERRSLVLAALGPPLR